MAETTMFIKTIQGVDVYLDMETNNFFCNIGIRAGNSMAKEYHNKTHKSTRLKKLEEAILAEKNNTDLPECIITINPYMSGNNVIIRRTPIARNGDVYFFKGGSKLDIRKINSFGKHSSIMYLIAPDAKSDAYQSILSILDKMEEHRKQIELLNDYLTQGKEEIYKIVKQIQNEQSKG